MVVAFGFTKLVTAATRSGGHDCSFCILVEGLVCNLGPPGFQNIYVIIRNKTLDIYIPAGDPILRIHGFNDFLLRLQVSIPVVNTQMYHYINSAG